MIYLGFHYSYYWFQSITCCNLSKYFKCTCQTIAYNFVVSTNNKLNLIQSAITYKTKL